MVTTDTKPTSTKPGQPKDSTANDLLKIIIAILLPPLGVLIEVGLTKHFWINIVLTLLGYIPGIVHAVYIIAKR